jgi:hypothetical protein
MASKYHIIYIDSIPVTSILISGEIIYANVYKVSNIKDQSSNNRIMTTLEIYNKLISTDTCFYIFDELYQMGLPKYRNYKLIDSLNNIHIYTKENFIIVEKFNKTNIKILENFINDNNKYYLNNYYIYDEYYNNYLVPKKDVLKNNLFIDISYTKDFILMLDRNFINNFFNISKEKPENIFDLFELSRGE